MSKHPAFTPSLGRSNVTMLLKYIDAEIAAATDGPAVDDDAAIFDAGRLIGLQRAREIVSDMWIAAVIASDALADAIISGDYDEGLTFDDLP